MMKKFDQTVLDAIGNTPIVKLKQVAKNVESEIYVKLEYMNPGGSIKDRIGKYILEKAVERGYLKPGGTVIEGTSGNTGVGLAMYAAIHGLKAVFVLADKQSPEKINNLRAFGAKVIVCPTNVTPEDPRSYYSVSKRLSETIPSSYYVNQYDNLLNRETHFTQTGPEIYQQTKGDFDVFMCGVGTGGTISGIGGYLKSQMSGLKVVGVDIEGSILAHYHKTGEISEARPYVLEGIGEDIIPKNIDFSVIDDFVTVGDKESFVMTRALLTHEGIYAGGSSGAAVVGAIKYARTLKRPQKILVILPDSGNRYASKIYNDDWMRDNGYNDSTFNVVIKDVLQALGRKQQTMVQLEESSSVGEAVAIMQKHGISQLPVVAKGEVIGVVTETDLLRPVFEGKLQLKDSLSLAYSRNFRLVNQNDLLEKVADALLRKNVVFITHNEQIVDILTDIDILQFVSAKGKY
jgi:cystathionine beta-synthase